MTGADIISLKLELVTQVCLVSPDDQFFVHAVQYWNCQVPIHVTINYQKNSKTPSITPRVHFSLI